MRIPLKSSLLIVASVLVGSALSGGCSAGAGSSETTGAGNASGSGGSTGNFVGSGGSSSSGSTCAGNDCIGNAPQGGCDGSLALDSADGMDGARAIGLCQVAENGSWGVISAEWVRSDGQPLTNLLPLGKGILNGFGPNVAPREGSQLLALSSGTARQPTDPGYQSVGGYWKDCEADPNCDGIFSLPAAHGTPAGFPNTSGSCNVQAGLAYDSAGLRVTLKTPTDAKSLNFNLKFHTFEFPDYICDVYNDFFVAIMSPAPAAALNGNISFDSVGNTISVNAGFLDVCNAQTASNNQYFDCMAGYSELEGTGFDEQDPGSAATSWLQTTAPIDAPGSEITLLFTIWDSGDGVLDSTILIDNFKFDLNETEVGTTPVPQ